MVLDRPGSPLRLARLAAPSPGAGQVLVRVRACGVCRTDLHVVDGELPEPKLPLVPGHQIVGSVEVAGPGVETLAPGERIGIPWLTAEMTDVPSPDPMSMAPWPRSVMRSGSILFWSVTARPASA